MSNLTVNETGRGAPYSGRISLIYIGLFDRRSDSVSSSHLFADSTHAIVRENLTNNEMFGVRS